METTVISFRLPDELIQAVDRLARQRGVRRSDVFRLALLREVKRGGGES